MQAHDDEPVVRHDDLGRALRALPLPRAPRTLAPRVMAAVAARLQRRDYTWFDWPLWAQVGSALGIVLLCAVGALGWTTLSSSPAFESDVSLIRAAVVVARAVWQPVMGTFLVTVTALLLMAGTCAALVSRVVFGTDDVTEMVR
ncbi:MAG: hypothetical protein AMXMBFR57_04250 [Acidimicrobiia bacterium]